MTEGSCCEPCMEMAAEILRASFSELAAETVDLSCWELIEDEELCEQRKPNDFRDAAAARGDDAAPSL
jgi:hypothetical protein